MIFTSILLFLVIYHLEFDNMEENINISLRKRGSKMINLKHHIFVCASCRVNGMQKGMCFSKESVKVVQKFMEEVEDRDLINEVMVTNTGCLGVCNKGPIVVVYPEGTWYGNVTLDDVERIMDEHIEGGKVVEELVI